MKMKFLAAVWFVVCTGSSQAGTRSFALPSVVGKQFVDIMRQGDVRAFADLLKTLPRPNISRAVVDEKGNTLLHLLAQRGRTDMIALAFLLSGNRLDAGMRNDAGGSAQQLAEDCRHDEVCSLLRSVQAVPLPPPLDRVFLFVGRIVQPRDPIWREGFDRIEGSLRHAAGHGEYGAVVALVHAMRLVEEMGLTDVNGIDMRSEFSGLKWLALEKAIYAHDTEVFDFLVANGAVRKGHLHEAAIANNVHAINSLLAAGIDVDAQGGPYHPHKDTALQVAALHGNIDAVVALLDAGADINYRNWSQNSRQNFSALDLALDGGERGLDINLVNTRVTARHLRLAKILIERGATITSTNVRKLALFTDSLTAGVNYDRDQIVAGIDTIIAVPQPIDLQHLYRRWQYAHDIL